MTDLPFVIETFTALARGVPLTVELAALSVTVGFCFAVMLALARRSGISALDRLVRAYVFVFRGSPLLVQIYLIYYGPGQFEFVRKSVAWSILREPYWCALISLSLVTAAYGSEVIRGGLDSVPAGLAEGATALGMSPYLSYRLVILPLALRNALPAYGNEVILMVKATSLASVITLMDVTGIAYRIISESYRVTPVFVMAGAIYLAINSGIVWSVSRLERGLSVGRALDGTRKRQ